MIKSCSNPLAYLILICLLSFSGSVQGDWHHPERISTEKASEGEQALAQLFGIQPLLIESSQNEKNELEMIARSGLNRRRIKELEIAIAAFEPVNEDLSTYPDGYGLAAMAQSAREAHEARKRKSMARNTRMPMLGNRTRNLQQSGFILASGRQYLSPAEDLTRPTRRASLFHNAAHKTVASKSFSNFQTLTTPETLLTNGRRNAERLAQESSHNSENGLVTPTLSDRSIGIWIFVTMCGLGLVCLKRLV